MKVMKCETERALTERREHEWNELLFVRSESNCVRSETRRSSEGTTGLMNRVNCERRHKGAG